MAQSEFQENLWLGTSVKKKWENSLQLNVDGGFRSFDHFIKQSRTVYGRVSLEKKWTEKHGLAAGYAFFDQINEANNPEHRAFIHYRFVQKWNSGELSLRLMNELRMYPLSENVRNRSRFQVLYRYCQLHKLFQPALGSELFLTPDTAILHEERFVFSIFSTYTDQFTTQLFYILQNQSFVSGLQHIIGLNLQFTLL